MKKQFLAAAAVASLAAFAGGTQDAAAHLVAAAQVKALIEPCSMGIDDTLRDPGKCKLEQILAGNSTLTLVSVLQWNPTTLRLERIVQSV